MAASASAPLKSTVVIDARWAWAELGVEEGAFGVETADVGGAEAVLTVELTVVGMTPVLAMGDDVVVFIDVVAFIVARVVVDVTKDETVCVTVDVVVDVYEIDWVVVPLAAMATTAAGARMSRPVGRMVAASRMRWRCFAGMEAGWLRKIPPSYPRGRDSLAPSR